MRKKGVETGRRLTLPGSVALRRERYERADRSSVIPCDGWLDQADKSISLGVRELACRLGMDSSSFGRAAGNLRAAAQLSLSRETLRQLVESEGQAVVQAQTAGQLEFDWRAAEQKVTGADGAKVSRAYLSTDGVMVPTVTQAEKRKRRAGAVEKRQRMSKERGAEAVRKLGPLPPMRPGTEEKFKEFKVVTLYDQERTHWAVGGTWRDHRHAGRLMRQLAGAVGLGEAQEKVGLIDGAVWAARQTRRNVPELDALTLDFHHLSGHVHQAKATLFGESSPEGQAWVQEMLHTVKHEGYEPFWQKLVERRATTRSPIKRRALDGLMHYAMERQEMINYPEHQKHGWDIGSGPMESMCKVTTRRLRTRGARWDRDNAQAVMALEALVQSQQWDRWWQKRLISLN